MSEQWPTAIGPGRSRNHIPENGQHQLGRETNSPGAEPYPDALQAVWVGAPAPREKFKTGASHPSRSCCCSADQVLIRSGSFPLSGGPPLGGRRGERSECF